MSAVREAEAERRQGDRQARERAALRAAWGSLDPSEQEEVRRHVLDRQPRTIGKFPTLVERLCLDELSRRRDTSRPG